MAVKLHAGDPAPAFSLTDIFGNSINSDALKGRKIMLSFYRYAACPLCNLRVNQLIGKSAEWEAAGLQMIAVFHSDDDRIKRHVGKQDAPFPIVGDPDQELYAQYGVHGDMGKFLAGVTMQPKKLLSAFSKGYSPFHFEPSTMIPADFLIDEDGTLHTAYYGKDASDHLDPAVVEAFIAS